MSGDALLLRAYEVVHHDTGCPSIGGNGDGDCECDAVPFLRDLKAALTAPDAVRACDEKYSDVLEPFVAMMRAELHANAGKGDRPGWLGMDRKTALLEIYYHLAKLQKATKNNATAGIREYAADVANMSMMLVDICGLLAARPQEKE